MQFGLNLAWFWGSLPIPSSILANEDEEKILTIDKIGLNIDNIHQKRAKTI